MGPAAIYFVQEKIKILDAPTRFTQSASWTNSGRRVDNIINRNGWPRSVRTKNQIVHSEIMFAAVSKDIHKTFVPGNRSFKFTCSHKAPESSPVSVQDKDFATSDRCE